MFLEPASDPCTNSLNFIPAKANHCHANPKEDGR